MTVSSDNLKAEAENTQYCAQLVRGRHYDHFLCALLAPKAVRADLFALYGFAAELAHIHQTVSEPMMGEIRLQWWREAIEEIFNGADARSHPVVLALQSTHGRRGLDRAILDRIINAHVADVYHEPADDPRAYAEAIGGGIMQCAARILGGDEDTARLLGTEAMLYLIDPALISQPATRLPKGAGGRAALPVVLAAQQAKLQALGKPGPVPSYLKQMALYRALLTRRI